MLTPEEMATLDRALADAERSGTNSLVSAIQTAIANGGGRELRFRAFLLIWAIARNPARLEEVHALLASESTGAELRKALLYVIGGVRSRESTDLLLRILDEPWAQPFMRDVVQALNQTKWADRETIEDQYRQMTHEQHNWRPTFGWFGEPSTDARVIDAMLRHGGTQYSPEVREECAAILSELRSWRLAKQIDPETTQKLHDFFVELARTETGVWAQEAAQAFLANPQRTDTAALAWETLSRLTPGSPARAAAGSLAASQVGSLADVTRIAGAIGQEGEAVRALVVAHLRTDFAKTPAERAQVSQVVAQWTMNDSSEGVRLQSLQVLAALLPDSAPSMQWALRDSSELVRTTAAKLLTPK